MLGKRSNNASSHIGDQHVHVTWSRQEMQFRVSHELVYEDEVETPTYTNADRSLSLLTIASVPS